MTEVTTFTDWVNEKVRRQAQSEESARREAEKVKLLPPDLAACILEAADIERARLLARLDEIDRALDDLAGRIQEARSAEREAVLVVENPPVIRERLDGQTVAIPQRPILIRGQAAIEAGKLTRGLVGWRARLEAERGDVYRRLREVREVRRSVEQDVVTGLLHIVRGWQMQISAILWKLLPPQSAISSDRGGNPVTEAEAEGLQRMRGRVPKE
jgi:hypothetical protein